MGNVRDFLMDIADAAYPGPASVTVAPLSEDDYDDVLDLVKREGVRGRSDRLGAEDKYGWVRERLFAPSEHGAVGGWRGEKLLGLLHLGVWSQSLGLWQVLHSAIDPEAGPGLTLFRDLLNGWQARAGIRVDAVKMGVPEEAQEVLERFKIARLKESWTRALVWYPGG
ncbi:hypothetical protein H8D30_00085 [bacterium]|nr:hypothetical protein [bacterium]